MKILILAALFVSAFYADTEGYFFCYSGAWRHESPEKGKIRILYTDISETQSDTAILHKRSRAWRAVVDQYCAHPEGCNSNLNFYYTYEEAKKQLASTLNRFSDTSKYIVRKIDF